MSDKILITGNLGYVGPSVIKQLRRAQPDAVLVGFDTGYFAHCLTGAAAAPETLLDAQHYGDVRHLDRDFLAGFDGVVHLAAISNDPMGNQFETATTDINLHASVGLARHAAAAGVRNFVFASSCSVYGIAEGGPRREEDPLNPITAYAKSKIGTEEALAALDTEMTVTCLRFATACGMSDRLRLDLVLNDFVAGALTSGRITVLSDGSPWRPLIDVADMARAIDWAVHRDAANGGRFLIVNAGTNSANYQVRDLARSVAAAVPGTDVSINTEAPADSRSYQVDFARFMALAPDHQPAMSLDDSIAALVRGVREMGFADADFRSSNLIRLRVLQGHLDDGRLNANLEWAPAA